MDKADELRIQQHAENTALMKYFMEQTNTRLLSIESTMKEFIAFKATMLAESKASAQKVSIVITLLGVIVQAVLHKMGVT